MSKNALAALLLAATVLAAGCGSLAPKYVRPEAPVPSEWPSGAAYPKSKEAAPAPAAQSLKWREFITDEKLRKVVETALENNRDLRLAALNVERARAQYGLQRGQLLPTIDAVGTENRQSATSVVGYISGEAGKAATPVVKRVISEQNMVNIGVASWEIDFFGRIQNLKKAAQQQFFASEEARRAAQILLVSEVAGAYYALAADQESLKLAQTTLDAQRGSYDLAKRRFECGVVSELDVHRAQTQVDTARGDVARYTRSVAQDENALNFLVGTPVSGELLASELDSIGQPKDISAGASSEILLSRPDVMQAEDLLKAANANIGAARAAFFPRITLSTGAGRASTELSTLFDAGTGVWSFAPQIVLPIFDTRTWHAARIARVDQKSAVAQYEKAIQNSFREVADALAVVGTIDEQVAAQESLVHAVEETYRLSNLRYAKGMDSYLSVLDAQRSLYAAQEGLVLLRLAKVSNQMRFYAVLGGGGDAPEAKPQS